MAADVAGYSRLMGEDEVGTLSALRQLRNELLVPKVSGHRGQIVKSMGDGWLVEFVSVADAVNCAIEVQEGLAGNEIIKLRVSVHLGDITHEDDDIYGDGVNIAARLQELAEPGAIVISDIARRSVDGKLAAAFNDLGAHTLKNIAEPVAAYGWGMTTVAAGVNALPLPSKPSIAVLPFDNMSGDPEQDYFADGITEDIITELARFQGLFVIARNSVFTYKGKAVRIEDVGRDLGVNYVVEGSVRKAGNRIRVTVQLVDTENGNHIWAERYDRDLIDIFDLQDELTRQIVATLPSRVEGADAERVKRTQSEDASVYDRVLKAKIYHHHGGSKENAEGLTLLNQAIDTDPNFAPAYAWRACTVSQGAARGYIPHSPELEDRIYQDVLKGLAIDENDLECIRILAEFRIEQRRCDEALALNDKALRLNPNDPRIVAQRSEIHTWRGNPDKGLELANKAMSLDPYDADAWAHMLGRALFGLRRYADAINAFIRVPGERYAVHAFMAAAKSYLKHIDDAEHQRQEVLRLKPDFNCAAFSNDLFYELDKDRKHIVDGLRQAGLPG